MVSHLIELHRLLQWPEPEHVFKPPGAGPAVYRRLAQLKIEAPLTREMGEDQVRVGVLAGNPSADTSDAPIGLVCEFNQALTPEMLNHTRKLAWNFCRTPLLITLEPHLVRAWSCFEKPDGQSGEFPDSPVAGAGAGKLSSLADTLHWIYLASGMFLSQNADRFNRNQRADFLLLENLRYVRERLTKDLDHGIAHDLLARVIFVQFLFDRKDAQGCSALNTKKLEDLHNKGILSKSHNGLPSILENKGDTFALFKWLNERFNGDLFPSGISNDERKVEMTHLDMLAKFVSGRLQMENGQYLLWPHYYFDTIPLEFISSIYEEFVTTRKDREKGIGEHYTRPFLVDFMLDKVLPWGGKKYDLKILDPCCGSAVFLVKAFQRLVHRWRSANPGKNPEASFLQGLLENNLFGVDLNENAVRVASFSLYLAMCDEIDPKHYWTQVRFPFLRGKRIRNADFFTEDVEGIRTKEDAELYDLVVGNAPWGSDSVTPKAAEWAENKDNGLWPIADKQTGTLFLAKAARLCKPEGRICMIQPAGSLLFNISSPAKKFRKKLFTQYKVDEVVNLSALRFLKIFPNAVSPSCIINMRPFEPDGEAIAYWYPKQPHTQEEQFRVVIDEQDLNWVWPEEAALEPIVWPALTLGGRRDFNAITRMKSSAIALRELESTRGWRIFTGFKRVSKSAKKHSDRIGIPCLEKHELFWKAHSPISVNFFPRNTNPNFERAHSLETFRLPLLIVGRSWRKGFKAILVLPEGVKKHLLYSQSFFAVSAPQITDLKRMALLINRPLYAYYLFLTSGRLASYRPTIREEDLRELLYWGETMATISDLGASECISNFALNTVEKALVEDFSAVVLPDLKATRVSRPPGFLPSHDKIEIYCDWFLHVLESGFGPGKGVCATIFRLSDPVSSPFCMVGIHLDWRRPKRIQYEDVKDGNLPSILEKCTQNLDTQKEAIYYRRVSRIYLNMPVKEGGKQRNVPTTFLIKPNQVRYWTRSAALRDADNVAADIMKYGHPGMSSEESRRG